MDGLYFKVVLVIFSFLNNEIIHACNSQSNSLERKIKPKGIFTLNFIAKKVFGPNLTRTGRITDSDEVRIADPSHRSHFTSTIDDHGVTESKLFLFCRSKSNFFNQQLTHNLQYHNNLYNFSPSEIGEIVVCI